MLGGIRTIFSSTRITLLRNNSNCDLSHHVRSFTTTRYPRLLSIWKWKKTETETDAVAMEEDKKTGQLSVESLEDASESKELTEEELLRKQNKSRLSPHHYRIMHGDPPYSEPMYWAHHTIAYKARTFGKFGEKSGVYPGLMWPTHKALDKQLEYEKVAFPHTIQEVVEKKKELRRLQAEEFERREKEVDDKMKKLEEMKKAIFNKQAAKERESAAAKTRSTPFYLWSGLGGGGRGLSAGTTSMVSKRTLFTSDLSSPPPTTTEPSPSIVYKTSSSSLPIEPHKLVESDLHDLVKDIRKELGGRHLELCDVAAYYFDGQGKAIRPLISILMARAINAHLHGNNSFILLSQKQLALVSEMIHTATLVHDDVIDTSDTRRGKPSVNALFGQKKAIIGGDYILAKAGAMVAGLNNDEVTQILAQVLEDLVQGEFMQMGANEGTTERFTHYIGKTFNKTASLMAYSCKGVAVLGGSDEALAEIAFQYGKNVGIAFQLMDDLLDFVSSTATMGKPAAADLQLGLATAPVLFAAQKHADLYELIERRFSNEGDVEKALDYVHNSDGLEQTKVLAQKYCLEAVRYANTLRASSYQSALITVTEMVLNRSK